MQEIIPSLQNHQIYLRQPEPEDLEVLYKWENDESLWKFGNTQTPLSKYILKDYISRSHSDIYTLRQIRLMICLKENQKCVGAVDLFDFDPFHLRVGVGIVIDQEMRRVGYAKMALELVRDYAAYHLGMKQLYCNITENNEMSISLFESIGFIQAGEKKLWTRIGKSWYSELIYQLLLD